MAWQAVMIVGEGYLYTVHYAYNVLILFNKLFLTVVTFRRIFFTIIFWKDFQFNTIFENLMADFNKRLGENENNKKNKVRKWRIFFYFFIFLK